MIHPRPLFLVLAVILTFGAVMAQTAGDGFQLLGDRNCLACHRSPAQAHAWIQTKVAPRLENLFHRVDPAWVRTFLLDPQKTHPGTTMPDVLASLPAEERAAAAEALTHHLFASAKGDFQRLLPDRAAIARGDLLFHQVGCVACHAPQSGTNRVHEPVPLPNLSAKWSHNGLRSFLKDPLSIRPAGRMPALNLTENEASDIAHFLLRDTHVPAPLEFTQFRGRIEALEDLDTAEIARTGSATGFILAEGGHDPHQAIRFSGWFEVRTHGLYTFHLNADGASRIGIDEQWMLGADSWQTERVSGKFSLTLAPGWHPIVVDYVHRGPKEPRLEIEWEEPGGNRCPIPASRLHHEPEIPAPSAQFVVDSMRAATGRDLYQRLHCAACHDSEPPAPHGPSLAGADSTRGCLADKPPSGVPLHTLSTLERSSLRQALAKLAGSELAPPTALEHVNQTLTTFRCVSCHRRDGIGGVSQDRDLFFSSNGEDLGNEGRIPPDLTGVGDRLQPDWLVRVLDEGVAVRPYLRARMPKFGKGNVGHLAPLFMELDRHADPIPEVPDSIEALREAGRKLLGTDGLSCIACHRFNRQPAHQMQVMDLGTVPQRLNTDWFHRFLSDPNRYHPETRMPSFWPEGVSALPGVLGGNKQRQHSAISAYLAEGPNAKFPEGLSRQNVELIVGGEAVVYRGKLWEAGFRAIATGYPGQIHAAFDAEDIRLSLLWRGRFLNAGAHWSVQGMGRIRPLGSDVVVLPHGPAFAILPSTDSAWPTNKVPGSGLRFHGYQLDSRKQPILLYEIGGAQIEDLLHPIPAGLGLGFRRTFKFTSPLPDGLYLRISSGPAVSLEGTAWRISDTMQVRIPNDTAPFVRGSDTRRELLVPIRNPNLEIDYVWTVR